MATWQDFYVAPTATQGLAQGLGTLGKAYFQKQAQQEQEKKIFDQRMGFMNAMKGAFSIQDPQERETALMDIQLQYPEQLTQFYQATQEQQKAQEAGQPKVEKDVRTSTQKEYDQYQILKESDPAAAKEFGRAAGFVNEQGQELSVHLQKRLSDATDMAIESRSNVAEFQSLADQIEKANIGGGIFQGSWAERVKDITGQQDAITSLRKRYNAIKGSQVVKNLPPGAASDADIALALAGFPTDNASGPQLASFLRGVAKLEERQADFNDFKADYISENRTERGMLKAYKERQEESEPREVENLTDSQKIDRVQKDLPLVNEQGWQLMTDAQGNKAYVGPNGQFKEVR